MLSHSRSSLTERRTASTETSAILASSSAVREAPGASEVRFIRLYFEMTLAEFGAKFGCSHVAVLKWEKQKNRFAKMEEGIDICIRLFLFSRLDTNDHAFKQLYEDLDIPLLVRSRKEKNKLPPIFIDLKASRAA